MKFQGEIFTKMHMAQRKCSSSYHSSFFIVMMLRGGFEKYRNIGDGIFGIKMLKQKMKERTWNYQQKPQEDEPKPLKKLWLNSSCEAEEKSL